MYLTSRGQTPNNLLADAKTLAEDGNGSSNIDSVTQRGDSGERSCSSTGAMPAAQSLQQPHAVVEAHTTETGRKRMRATDLDTRVAGGSGKVETPEVDFESA